MRLHSILVILTTISFLSAAWVYAQKRSVERERDYWRTEKAKEHIPLQCIELETGKVIPCPKEIPDWVKEEYKGATE